MGTVTTEYAASSDLTVTALQSLAASSSFTSGWTSNAVSNTSDKHLDKVVTAKFTTAGSNTQAGEIRVYVYGQLDDSNWGINLSAGTAATEGTCTIIDTEQAQNSLILLWAGVTDAGASEVHYMPPTSIRGAFGGFMPSRFCIFVTGTAATSTNAQFASSGNQVTVKGIYESVA